MYFVFHLSITIQNTHSNTETIMKYERYNLILEHADPPLLFPPFSLIFRFFDLIFLCKNKNSKKSEKIIKCKFIQREKLCFVT